ncbi:uncharacterized protein LOC114322230 [Camellia sinensis]|uniref:uncharacterized protein LOC114322230 n=1 Tax=Camellia sinensis TaxID=4442 RepID=UPI00103574D1|nr:uncharacterized protein LOC114322230 [Camellia sinensis]
MVLGMINEIQQYLDARYIGPPEAAWRIFGHPLHAEMPTVVRLAFHLPGMHRVFFNPEESLQTIQSRAGQQMSTLTGFFAYCAASEDECPFTYQEFPLHFVWLKSEKRWKSRERGYSIGRMYFASPNCGERFYLYLLLIVVKGPKSFRSLRTVDNVVHDTFKLTCIPRELLEDDEEWIQCLKEAAVMKTGYQLRRLFNIILTQCSLLNPCALWNQFSTHICDDLAHKIRKCLIDFPPMPQPTANWSTVVGNQLIFEHQQLQNEAQQVDPQITIDCLNNGQQNAYNSITSSIFQNKGTVFFLNGGARTGKTFMYNTIALKCHSLRHIVVTVASSGIASLLLDKVSMQHRHCVEPVDRTLRDIRDSVKPFGDITVVLGGDFRQILPVIPKGIREQIDWIEKFMELKRRNTTSLLRWGCNKGCQALKQHLEDLMRQGHLRDLIDEEKTREEQAKLAQEPLGAPPLSPTALQIEEIEDEDQKVLEDVDKEPADKSQEPLKKIKVNEGDEERFLHIGYGLAEEEERKLEASVRENMKVFVWTPYEMAGVNPEVTCHKLNVDRMAKSIIQKARRPTLIHVKVVEEEVKKLLEAQAI